MNRRAAAIPIALLLAAAPCAIAGPNPCGERSDPAHTVAVSERIAAPIAEVWSLAGNFEGLARWNPTLRALAIHHVAGHVTRTASFDGWSITERLDQRDDANHRLRYAVITSTRPANIGARASIALTAAGPAATDILWCAIEPAGASPPPAAQAALAGYFHTRIGHLRAAVLAARPAAGTHP